MTVESLYTADGMKMVCGGDGSKQIDGVYCCDMLSVAMSKAPAGSCWVTVVCNLNTLAVASLTDCACVIIAGGVLVGDDVKAKAEAEGIALFSSEEPVFETALKVHGMLGA
ncbi:MAG: hypothetical protein K6E95_09190 [Lachnospiraceae bacterium]|nr:hypothetical protein [Lachnospiraceae bacterium]